jgi:hypothetical protein
VNLFGTTGRASQWPAHGIGKIHKFLCSAADTVNKTTTFGTSTQQAQLICQTSTSAINFYDHTNAATFVQEGNASNDQGNEEIVVDAGTVTYVGFSNTNGGDSIKMPVYVNGGTFVADGDGSANLGGGTLKIFGSSTDTDHSGTDYSFGMASGTTTLKRGVTVNADQGVYASGGTIEAADDYETALNTNSNGLLIGGTTDVTWVLEDAGGKLDFGGNTQFTGQAALSVRFDGGNNGVCDLLTITGTQTTASTCLLNLLNTHPASMPAAPGYAVTTASDKTGSTTWSTTNITNGDGWPTGWPVASENVTVIGQGANGEKEDVGN